MYGLVSEGDDIALYDDDSKQYKVILFVHDIRRAQDLNMTNRWCRTDQIRINAIIIHCTHYLSSHWLRAHI